MKFILSLTVFILFTSCHTYRMYDGKSMPVIFTADSSVFQRITYSGMPVISYADLANLNGDFFNIVTLKRDEAVTTIIAHPTIFKSMGSFLVFPGEKINVTQTITGDFIYSVRHNMQRNRELNVLNKFDEIDASPFFLRYRAPSLDTMTAIENEIKTVFESNQKRVIKLFDSLLDVTKVSNRFKSATRYYAQSRYAFSLFNLYDIYRDSLLSHGIFKEKCRALLPEFNRISNIAQLSYNINSVTDFANVILPYSNFRIRNADQFESDYTEIEKSFTGFMRDYFLSTLIYSAYSNNIQIKAEFIQKYKSQSSTKDFKKIIDAVIAEKTEGSKNNIDGNSLFSVNRKKAIRLDELINQNKGKIILLDFMASWCTPCLADIPALKEIKKKYRGKDIVFLNISIDKQVQPWRKFIYATGYDKEDCYLLTDFTRCPLVKQYNIATIPRYIMLNKQGKVINADVPRPTNKALENLIDSSLNNNR